jgi:hypothetical protein
MKFTAPILHPRVQIQTDAGLMLAFYPLNKLLKSRDIGLRGLERSLSKRESGDRGREYRQSEIQYDAEAKRFRCKKAAGPFHPCGRNG